MPLFMFLSGIFAFSQKSEWKYLDFRSFLKKKFLRILIPFIFIGSLYSFLFNGKLFGVLLGEVSSYWFLAALFMCMLLGYLTLQTLFYINKKKSIVLDIVLSVALWVVVAASYFTGYMKDFPYYLNFIKMYPFFLYGVLFTRHNQIKQFFESHLCYTFSYFIYILCFIWQDVLPFNFNFTGFPAIVILMFLFRKFELRIPIMLTNIGLFSLEIYVFHWFFLPNFSNIGIWLMKQPENTNVITNQNFIVLFGITLFVALVIIYFCKIMKDLVNSNRILNLLCFGVKSADK